MAGLDGEGMLAELTHDEELRGIPVLMVSSDGTRDRADRLVAMGAKGYLVKPFHPEVLRAELQRILEASRA
jgi:two-component system, chemotaxis family, chemotaxis protein CheY